MGKPLFIVLEGIDGSGKSTQCRMLSDCFRSKGLDVLTCADPGGTVAGDELRLLLLSSKGYLSPEAETFMFMASRAELVHKVIRPALASGQVVISDRFLLSNIVYQGYAGGMGPERIRDYSLFATGGIEPDLTVILDLPVPDAVQRRQSRVADRMESRDVTFHEAVRRGFLAEAEKNPDRVFVVDARQDKLRVAASICTVIGKSLPEEYTTAKCALHE